MLSLSSLFFFSPLIIISPHPSPVRRLVMMTLELDIEAYSLSIYRGDGLLANERGGWWWWWHHLDVKISYLAWENTHWSSYSQSVNSQNRQQRRRLSLCQYLPSLQAMTNMALIHWTLMKYGFDHTLNLCNMSTHTDRARTHIWLLSSKVEEGGLSQFHFIKEKSLMEALWIGLNHQLIKTRLISTKSKIRIQEKKSWSKMSLILVSLNFSHFFRILILFFKFLVR